ncbi:dermonecrotic toxin domain-containing protein [Pseudomonas arcuscaelestis]|nr:DUF6543 domain-containing protein [Pseudomonas arcuscaelestis]
MMSSIPQENPHQLLIQHQLPSWSRASTVDQWQALQQSLLPAQGLPDDLADWFANAPPDRREAVQASQARLARSQQTMARELKGLKNISEFAEPLLAQHLLAQFQLQVPVDTTELIHIRHLFTWETYVSQHERRSLLEAALHNFEDGVEFSRESALALAGKTHIENTLVIGKTTLGDSETLVDIELTSESYRIESLAVTPAAFADACRALDLGRLYQEHLTSLHAPDRIATQAIGVYRDRLRLAADLAFLRQRINGTALDRVQAFLDQDATLASSQLRMFGITVHEVLIYDLDNLGLLLYLPGHNDTLQQFPNMAALHDHLRDALLQADFRQRFLDYAERDQQSIFLSRLRQNLDANGSSSKDQTWPLREDADLHIERIAVEAELFGFLFLAHVTRLKSEARQIAVPTADADEQARQRRLAQWEAIGMNTMMLAGFIVPGVGSLMTAVMGYQLLDEVYEGYQSWRVGDRDLAVRHLQAVGLNLALIGGLHVAGKWVPKLFNSPLMESLDAVTLTDGSSRLWRPDLTSYRSTVQLPETLQPNTIGQYAYQGRHYIRMDGQLYEHMLDPDQHVWRIAHPSDAKAYQPHLEHNGEGAWRAEHEQPHQWSLATLVRRLDARLQGLSDERLEQAARIAGVDAGQLRTVHLGGERTPLLLADTLTRLSIVDEIAQQQLAAPELDAQALFEQLYHGPAVASPLQARLIEQYPRLSAPLARRLLATLQPSEVQALDGEATLPAWLQRSAEQTNSDLPMTRALEGLCRARLGNADSERLALLAVQRLPGWTSSLRLELHAGSADGILLARAGAEDAPLRRVVIKSADGYEAFVQDTPRPGTPTDLCTAIVRSLPASIRQRMSLEQMTGDALQVRLIDTVNQQRARWARQLWRATEGWPSNVALRGGAPLDPTEIYTPSPRLHSTLAARYRRLFPVASEHEVEQTLARWQSQRRFASVELQRLEDRLAELHNDLRRWANDLPNRQRAIRPIVNAWRRLSNRAVFNGESMPVLELGCLDLENLDIAELALPNTFTHVQVIDLGGNRMLSELPAEFLERFPRLRSLYLRGCRFATVPRIANPLMLNWLDLEANRITWDVQAQAALDRLQALDMLDLSENPLLDAPSFHEMRNLRAVHLANCSLSQLPQGLQAMEQPMIIDLEDNQFESLPEGFNLPPAHAAAMRLESDALSDTLQDQIRTYYQQHGIDLLLTDSDYDDLLDNISADERALWERVPLDFRRDLRLILQEDAYMADPQGSHEGIWARLERMDQDPQYRLLAIELGAEHLLRLPL